ncbi:MAG TPA: site-specific integrase [Polyangiaceae bacterium]
MTNSSSVTRGGVTYLVPEPTLRADEVIHSLRIGGSRYFFAERVPEHVGNDAPPPSRGAPSTWLRTSKANDEPRPAVAPQRAGLVSGEELARMWSTLDLSEHDDLRVAALFILLCAGLRKSEIVALNFGDLSEESGILQLRVRGTRASDQQERLVFFEDDPKLEALRRYVRLEHKETQSLDAPLLWTLGRHGTCRRVRITTHALSYWVSQLQRRAGIERRLSPHAFRRAWLAAGLETG